MEPLLFIMHSADLARGRGRPFITCEPAEFPGGHGPPLFHPPLVAPYTEIDSDGVTIMLD